MRRHRRELLRMIERGRAIFPPEIRARLPEPELVVDALGSPWSRKARKARKKMQLRSIEGFQAEWAEELRVSTAQEPGFIILALRPGGEGDWIEVELGTGDVDDLIGWLAQAEAEARARSAADIANPS